MKRGRKEKPVLWNGKRFDSLKKLEIYLGLSRGYTGFYIRNDYPLKGHYLDYAL